MFMPSEQLYVCTVLKRSQTKRNVHSKLVLKLEKCFRRYSSGGAPNSGMRNASSVLSDPESSFTQSFFAAEVFIVGSANGKAEDAGQAALHTLSPADGLCIVEIMAAARRTHAIPSETH